MKLALLLIAFLPVTLLAGALDPQPSNELWAIEGEVLSVVDDGILVLCIETTKVGLLKPKGGDVVFIKGPFPSAADGDKVSYRAQPIGRYRYGSAGGASKTVRAFALRR